MNNEIMIKKDLIGIAYMQIIIVLLILAGISVQMLSGTEDDPYEIGL